MAEQGLKINIGADVTDLNKGLAVASNSLNNFNKSVQRSVPQASTALFSLSRVAQDLPFGFIGIQNNIEQVVTSFGALRQSTGSTSGALTALLRTLTGAGGVLFAFSAISAGITALVQKYGSLGAAITELSASQEASAVNQRALNAELLKTVSAQQGEIQTAKNLVAAIGDINKSQLERTNAYKQLAKEFPGIIQGLSEENALTESGVFLLNERTKQLIQYINLKARENALIKLGEEATKRQLEAAKTSIDNFQNQNTILNRLINSIVGVGDANRGLAIRLKEGEKDFNKAGTAVDFYANALKQVQDELLTFDPKLTGLEKVKATVDKALKEVAKVNKVTIERLRLEVQTVDFDRDQPALRRALIDQPLEVPLRITVPQEAFSRLRELGESNSLKNLEDRTKSVVTQFNDFLAPAINTVFGALENGQSIPKAIGQAFKALIVQITATIAKAAILAAILNAIFPGGAAIGGAAVKGFGSIFGALLGGGNVAAPSFGGIQGGGFNFGGQVLLTARGTDLVGVLNAGQNTIRRVG